MAVFRDGTNDQDGPALLGLPALELLQVGISPEKGIFAWDEPFMENLEKMQNTPVCSKVERGASV